MSEVCDNCGMTIDANVSLHKLRCQRLAERCSVCYKVVEKGKLELHQLETHTLVQCPDCHEQFETQYLSNHISDKCVKRKVKCNDCDEFYCADEALDHDCLIECICCNEQVKSMEMAGHMERCKIQCDQCGEKVLTLEMSLHLEKSCHQVANRTERCDRCKRWIPVIEMIWDSHRCVEISENEKESQDENHYKCPSCNHEPFDDPSGLLVHRIDVHKYEPVICPQCGEQFENTSQLGLHKKIMCNL